MLRKLMIFSAIAIVLLNVGGTILKIMGNPIGDYLFMGGMVSLLALIVLAIMTSLKPKAIRY